MASLNNNLNNKLKSDTKKSPLILVDGSGYLFRAFFALPPLTSPSGHPTGAILGFLNMLKRLMQDHPTHHLAVVFDAKGKTFRHDMYEEYKANRAKMPDDLGIQIQPLQKIIELLGVPLIIESGVEADDVLASIASYFADNKDQDILVATSDKDLAQIVSDKINLVDTMKDKILNIKSVKEKFGVNHNQIIDYLSLIGDTSDNIPGVPKVGPKTAIKWLEEYNNLDNIIKNAELIKGKVGQNLRDNIKQLNLSRELVTIKYDVKINQDLDFYKLDKVNNLELEKFFSDLGFNRWSSQLSSINSGDNFFEWMLKNKSKKSSQSQDQGLVKELVKKININNNENYICIENMSQWKDFFTKIKNSEIISLDTETTSLNTQCAKLVGFSIGWSDQAIYVPLGHDDIKDDIEDDIILDLDIDILLKDFKEICESEKIKKVGQNLKYDYEVLFKHNIILNNIYFDTLLASFVLDSGNHKHNLDFLAKKYFDHKCISFEDLAGKGVKQKTFNQILVKDAYIYASEDAYITYKLFEVLQDRLEKDVIAKKLFFEQEMPLLNIIAKMELDGVLVDADELNKQSVKITKLLSDLQEQIWSITQCEFNIDSPKQLIEILYDKMGLPVLSKTPKGKPSTSESALTQLAGTYEIAQLLLKYRHYAKLKNTYLDKLPGLLDENTGRIHASFHQTGTVTGRLSSSDPNLQNIPMRTPEGADIRKAFVARKGWNIISADYSQIELRLMAHLSEDESLIDSFNKNLDVHKITASEVFGCKVDDVTNDQRRIAKAINFGLMYGMSAFGLAKQLNIGRKESQEYIDKYFANYPKVKDFIENTRTETLENGYVSTIFGRKLYFPNLQSQPVARREGVLRSAINAPLQGSAADLIKRAMVALDKLLRKNKLKAELILQVHDELVLEVPSDEVDLVKKCLNDSMINAANLKIPLLIDMGVNHHWHGAH